MFAGLKSAPPYAPPTFLFPSAFVNVVSKPAAFIVDIFTLQEEQEEEEEEEVRCIRIKWVKKEKEKEKEEEEKEEEDDEEKSKSVIYNIRPSDCQPL